MKTKSKSQMKWYLRDPKEVTRKQAAEYILRNIGTPEWRGSIIADFDASLPHGIHRLICTPGEPIEGVGIEKNGGMVMTSDGELRTVPVHGSWANDAEAAVMAAFAGFLYPPVPGMRNIPCKDGTLSVRFNCQAPWVQVQCDDDKWVSDVPLLRF